MNVLQSFSILQTLMNAERSSLVAMHLPDGFLNIPVSVITWAMAVALIAVALKRVQSEYQERAVPLMGVCAAFIFAAQMINFPIPGGTSGHLLGGTLVGALLGPWAGSLVMASVFIVQGVIFQDGGITVMGANILNMGLIGTLGGYYLFATIRRVLGPNQLRSAVVASAVAAWCSVIAAALACAVELAVSGTVPLNVALVAMLGWHVLIGVGEALITVATITFVWRSRPDLFFHPPKRSAAALRSYSSIR